MTAIFAGGVTDSKIRGVNDPCLFGLMCSFFAGASLGILSMGRQKHEIQEVHARGESRFKTYLLVAKNMQDEKKETESYNLF